MVHGLSGHCTQVAQAIALADREQANGPVQGTLKLITPFPPFSFH